MSRCVYCSQVSTMSTATQPQVLWQTSVAEIKGPQRVIILKDEATVDEALQVCGRVAAGRVVG